MVGADERAHAAPRLPRPAARRRRRLLGADAGRPDARRGRHGAVERHGAGDDRLRGRVGRLCALGAQPVRRNAGLPDPVSQVCDGAGLRVDGAAEPRAVAGGAPVLDDGGRLRVLLLRARNAPDGPRGGSGIRPHDVHPHYPGRRAQHEIRGALDGAVAPVRICLRAQPARPSGVEAVAALGARLRGRAVDKPAGAARPDHVLHRLYVPRVGRSRGHFLDPRRARRLVWAVGGRARARQRARAAHGRAAVLGAGRVQGVHHPRRERERRARLGVRDELEPGLWRAGHARHRRCVRRRRRDVLGREAVYGGPALRGRGGADAGRAGADRDAAARGVGARRGGVSDDAVRARREPRARQPAHVRRLPAVRRLPRAGDVADRGGAVPVPARGLRRPLPGAERGDGHRDRAQGAQRRRGARALGGARGGAPARARRAVLVRAAGRARRRAAAGRPPVRHAAKRPADPPGRPAVPRHRAAGTARRLHGRRAPLALLSRHRRRAGAAHAARHAAGLGDGARPLPARHRRPLGRGPALLRRRLAGAHQRHRGAERAPLRLRRLCAGPRGRGRRLGPFSARCRSRSTRSTLPARPRTTRASAATTAPSSASSRTTSTTSSRERAACRTPTRSTC